MMSEIDPGTPANGGLSALTARRTPLRAAIIVRLVAPHAKQNYLAAFDAGDAILAEHEVTTPLRLAHFLAQVMHETGALTIEEENGNYSASRLIEVFGGPRTSSGSYLQPRLWHRWRRRQSSYSCARTRKH